MAMQGKPPDDEDEAIWVSGFGNRITNHTGGIRIRPGVAVLIPAPAPRPRYLRPDPKQPDTLGWRAWLWEPHIDRLISPHQHTPWSSEQLAAVCWSDEGAVRGETGIHARLLPKHWKIIGWPDDDSSSGLDEHPHLVTGIVERFGRYVLGTEGWRAEQVIIRELMAPSTAIGLELERLYPNAIVHYSDQSEETPCTSEKSSELERGTRSLLPQTQPAPSPPSSPLLLPGVLMFQKSPSPSLSVNWNPSNPPPGFQPMGPPTVSVNKCQFDWLVWLPLIVPLIFSACGVLGFLIGRP